MSILIVHLSDIHITTDKDQILKKGDEIARAVSEHIATASLIVVVVSGDIAYSGQKKQYLAAKIFLEGIRKKLTNSADCPVEFLLCPGNHDCDFEVNNTTRTNNIQAIQTNHAVDKSVIQSCTRIQDEFFRFKEGIETWKKADGDRLWRTTTITTEGKNVVFDSLNVAWVSNLKEDKNLFFPVERYEQVAREKTSDLRIVVFHHPFNWFNHTSYKPLRRLLRDIGSVLISGHEHEGNVGLIDELESGKSLYIEGRVLQQSSNDLSGTGFFALIVDLGAMTLRHINYSYSEGLYKPQADEKTWELPSGRTNRLAPSEKFQKILEDTGAISHPDLGAKITLQDIYVYPDLRKVHQGGAPGEFVNSRALENPAETVNGVIVQSDERTGSTSLLYQLFISYLDQGFSPILLRGSAIKIVAEPP